MNYLNQYFWTIYNITPWSFYHGLCIPGIAPVFASCVDKIVLK